MVMITESIPGVDGRGGKKGGGIVDTLGEIMGAGHEVSRGG